jgi:hypothetical protein
MVHWPTLFVWLYDSQNGFPLASHCWRNGDANFHEYRNGGGGSLNLTILRCLGLATYAVDLQRAGGHPEADAGLTRFKSDSGHEDMRRLLDGELGRPVSQEYQPRLAVEAADEHGKKCENNKGIQSMHGGGTFGD